MSVSAFTSIATYAVHSRVSGNQPCIGSVIVALGPRFRGDERLRWRDPDGYNMNAHADWPDRLYDTFKRADIRQVAYVPDAGHARLIDRCRADPHIKDIVLTTEEEGVALAAGAWLGGERAALLMQSSGLGNCVNMFSLMRTLPLSAADADHHARRVGRVQSVAAADGLDRRRRHQTVRRRGLSRANAGRSRRRGRARGATGLRQRAHRRGRAVAAAHRQKGLDQMRLERRAAMATLLAERADDLLVVPGLGSTAWDLAAAGDNDRNFYLWGAMGGAAMIGLGLALAQPTKRVAVITGDGEMLMGMGALATIGIQRPNNLAVIVFDNGVYGETGMQPSATQGGVDLIGVAQACGIADLPRRARRGGARRSRRPTETLNETLFARVLIEAAEPPRVLPERDGSC